MAATGLDWPDVGAALLMDVDGCAAEAEHTSEVAVAIARRTGAIEVRVPKNDDERMLMWKGRKSAFAAMGRIGPNYIVQDGVIPRTDIARVLAEIARLSDERGLRVANVFHAGDGNLHPLVLYDAKVPGQEQRAEELAGEILRICIRYGGSITGEHGVGADKAPVHGGDVHRGRPRHHGQGALRLRSRDDASTRARSSPRPGSAATARASTARTPPSWPGSRSADDASAVGRVRDALAAARQERPAHARRGGGGPPRALPARTRGCSSSAAAPSSSLGAPPERSWTWCSAPSGWSGSSSTRRWIRSSPSRPASRLAVAPGHLCAAPDRCWPSTRPGPTGRPSAAWWRRNAFGPRRTRYGSIRDLIIGVSIVRADGTRGPGRRQGGEERRRVRPSQADGRLARHAGAHRHRHLPAPPAARDGEQRCSSPTWTPDGVRRVVLAMRQGPARARRGGGAGARGRGRPGRPLRRALRAGGSLRGVRGRGAAADREAARAAARARAGARCCSTPAAAREFWEPARPRRARRRPRFRAKLAAQPMELRAGGQCGARLAVPGARAAARRLLPDARAGLRRRGRARRRAGGGRGERGARGAAPRERGAACRPVRGPGRGGRVGAAARRGCR